MSAVKVADLFFCHTHGYPHAAPNEDGMGVGGVICHGEVWPGVVEALDVQTLKVEPVNQDDMYVLASDDFAYLDTLDGLVPCKVLSIDKDGVAEVVLTATRGPWVRGRVEVLANPRMSLVKREQVSTSKGRPNISGHTLLATDEGELL